MSRLTNSDRNFGPFTIARWKNRFELSFNSGGGYDEGEPKNHFLFVAFGWALRIYVPNVIKPHGERYDTHNREYGIILSKGGDSYDYLQIHYGPQTMDSRTTKGWSKFIPWTQWKHVRTSIYNPDGTIFATEEKGKWKEWHVLKDSCPKTHFGFEDYDGDMRIASCIIEEREWHKGEGWFKWLRFFSKPQIRREIWMEFDYEVGPEKGSWKGGTCATGIDMLPCEDPEMAFRRWCEEEHRSKYRTYKVRFIGKSKPPEPHEIRVARNIGWKQCDYPHALAKDSWYHADAAICADGKYVSTEEMLACIKAERDEHNAKVSTQVA